MSALLQHHRRRRRSSVCQRLSRMAAVQTLFGAILPSLSVAAAAAQSGLCFSLRRLRCGWISGGLVTGASPSHRRRGSLSRWWLPEGAVCVFSTIASSRKLRPSCRAVALSCCCISWVIPPLPPSFLPPDIQSVFHSSALLPVTRGGKKKKVNNYAAWVQSCLHHECEHAWEVSHKSEACSAADTEG